jgi:hypothetical protein
MYFGGVLGKRAEAHSAKAKFQLVLASLVLFFMCLTNNRRCNGREFDSLYSWSAI